MAIIIGGCARPENVDRAAKPRRTAETQGIGTHPSEPADMVIVNAKVWTGSDTEPHAARDSVTALAIRSGRIVAVGDEAAIRPLITENTKRIDAQGRRVIPGITDSHTHLVSGGFQLARLNLRGVADRESFVRAIGAEAKRTRPGRWVLGGRWSVESWANPQFPTKEWIDPITGDTPVFLNRMDGHQSLVNSAALRVGGIDASEPPDPKGGEIERDPTTGEPTGILKESAMDLVARHIPEPDMGERHHALLRAMRHANALGITSAHDMSEESDLLIFRRCDLEGSLTLRITAYLSVSDWASYAERIDRYGLDSEMARLVGFKGYMDGSLGSRTAYMREPYNDSSPESPYPRGQLTASADPFGKLRESVAAADARGLQLAVHAIGDQANHLLLTAYAYARQRNGPRDSRHRVEHAQHLRIEDIPRFAKLGVVASMQPFHKADDGRYAERAIGAERLRGSYAYRELVDDGALVVFGSDWPVVTMNPFAGIDAAVNARTLSGAVWLPEHSLTLEEVLRAYTVSPPKAIHREAVLGTIEPGKFADIVILEDDPFASPKNSLNDVRVAKTIVGGRIVYERPE